MCPVQTVTYVSGRSPSIYGGILTFSVCRSPAQKPICQLFANFPGEQTKAVWSKDSNGLKWRSVGFCTGSLFEWASPTQKQRLRSFTKS